MYSQYKAKQVWGSPNSSEHSYGDTNSNDGDTKSSGEKRILQRLPTVAAKPDDHHRIQIKATFNYPKSDSPLLRKPRLTRRPKRRSTDELSTDRDGRSLYTISASSKSRALSGMTNTTITDIGYSSSGAISQTIHSNKNFDVASKPTNFATICSQPQYQSFLPKLSVNSQSPVKTNTNFGRSSGLKASKSRGIQSANLPDLEASLHARRHWVNAELKVFPVWHELMKTKTDVHNHMPPVSAIYLEKMVDEMRQKKLRSPDRICFSNFAEAVKSANSHAYKEHVNGRSCYSPLPGPNDNYRHGIKEEYTYSTEDTGRYSSKF